MLEKYKSLIRFNCTAILSAFSDWVTFLILNQLGVFFVYSQMVARLVGGVTSFAVNKYWVFQSPRKTHLLLQGRRFIMLFIFSYFLSNYLLYFLVQWLRFPLLWAKLMADGVCYIANFFIMKNYVYFAERSISRSVKEFMCNRLKTR
jgi:putative flippase GtrA